MAIKTIRIVKKNVKITARIDDTKWQEIKKEIGILNDSYTLVGFPKGETHRGGQLVSAIAAYNEFGTKRIPERPFMRNKFDSNINKIFNFIKKLYIRVLEGRLKGRAALKLLGEYWQGEIKESIIQWNRPPNSPVTIAIKGSSNPLINTGQMLNSVRHNEFYNDNLLRGKRA